MSRNCPSLRVQPNNEDRLLPIINEQSILSLSHVIDNVIMWRFFVTHKKFQLAFLNYCCPYLHHVSIMVALLLFGKVAPKIIELCLKVHNTRDHGLFPLPWEYG